MTKEQEVEALRWTRNSAARDLRDLPVDADNLRNWFWRKVIDQAEVPGHGFHGLRASKHACAASSERQRSS